jgi:hypothetical protein
MNADFIRGLLEKQPFEPFEIHLTNGEKFPVRHPEQVLLAGARLIVHYPETDQIAFCSLLHLANVLQPIGSAVA